MRARYQATALAFALFATTALTPHGSVAQTFSGTFAVADEAGGIMTLTLQETGGGAVTGSLASSGATYRVEGRVVDDVASGMMRGRSGVLFFEAERWDDELWVMLYRTDALGQPNYDDYEEIDFVLQSPAVSGGFGRALPLPSQPLGGGNPLGAAGAGNPLGTFGNDPYSGTFSDGSVTLRLAGGAGQYQGQLDVGGVTYPVQMQGDTNGVQGVIQAADGSYQIVARAFGGGLVVASGGAQYSLARQDASFGQGTGVGQPGIPIPPGGLGAGAGTAEPRGGAAGAPTGAGRRSAGRQLAPGFTEDHAQVREWRTFLSGKKVTTISSYSSRGAGGYNARTDIYLCSDHSFAMRDQSSVNIDVGGVGGASGGVGAAQGRWYVITNGEVVGLILEFEDGRLAEVRMDYVNQETYANGERAYVTPAEVCM